MAVDEPIFDTWEATTKLACNLHRYYMENVPVMRRLSEAEDPSEHPEYEEFIKKDEQMMAVVRGHVHLIMEAVRREAERYQREQIRKGLLRSMN